MKLIDVTNSYRDLVNKQLESTDASYVKIYSLGKTTVIYTKATTHNEIVIVNKHRNVSSTEIDTIVRYLIDPAEKVNNLNMIQSKGLVEISLPVLSNSEVLKPA